MRPAGEKCRGCHGREADIARLTYERDAALAEVASIKAWAGEQAKEREELRHADTVQDMRIAELESALSEAVAALRTISTLVDDDFRLSREGRPQLSRESLLNMLQAEADTALRSADRNSGEGRDG